MAPQISPMLAVADAAAAIDFYKTAFDATVLWRLGGTSVDPFGHMWLVGKVLE